MHFFVFFIYYYHNVALFFWQKIQNFGEPFLLVIHGDETLSNVKIRVQKKLHVPDEEFSKVVCLNQFY